MLLMLLMDTNFWGLLIFIATAQVYFVLGGAENEREPVMDDAAGAEKTNQFEREDARLKYVVKSGNNIIK